MKDDEVRLLMTEAYTQVEKMIYRIIHRHISRYGGNWDEFLEVAHEQFVNAVYSWDPGKGAFTTHVYTRVFNGVRNHAARTLKKNEREARILYTPGGAEGPLAESLPARQPSRLARLLSSLSGEAREVFDLLLELPRSRGAAGLSALAEALMESGWAAAEILEAFNEIREVLHDE